MFWSLNRPASLSLTSISSILLAISVAVKLIGILWVQKQLSELTKDHSYIGDDYPEQWPIERKPVLMTFDNPKHFKLDEEDGIAEWGALAPQNGVVHLGPAKQPYTVAMLHQLKCLDIIRRDMVAAEVRTSDADHEGRYSGPSALDRHCLNYMRQMVMCHGDWELESFQFASHIKPIDWYGVYECMDWEAVYNAVKDNQKEYAEWLRNGGRARS